ncbi:MAG: signal peptidase I [Acidobacteria bacterium]|nr:signal peptidase I [Acidobacteriota bacterium]
MALSMVASSCLVPVVFEGMSMSPAIEDGDRILFSMYVSEVERGDIIQFRHPKEPQKSYVKRVVGLPQETIEIRDGEVFVNDVRLDEPYVDSQYNQMKTAVPPRLIPHGHYYVLGDNRDNSSDSRLWGTVEESLIERKYYWKYASGSSR